MVGGYVCLLRSSIRIFLAGGLFSFFGVGFSDRLLLLAFSCLFLEHEKKRKRINLIEINKSKSDQSGYEQMTYINCALYTYLTYFRTSFDSARTFSFNIATAPDRFPIDGIDDIVVGNGGGMGGGNGGDNDLLGKVFLTSHELV